MNFPRRRFRYCYLVCAIVVFDLLAAAAGAATAPSLGVITVTPSSVPANTATTVVFSLQSSNPNILTSTVQLIEVGQHAAASRTLGLLQNNGGGKFSLSLTMKEAVVGSLNFRVSAALPGYLRRAMSDIATIQIAPGGLAPAVGTSGTVGYLSDSDLDGYSGVTTYLRDGLKGAALRGAPRIHGNAPVTIIDFESLSDGDFITTQYANAVFSNAQVFSAGISLNEFEFPPKSGTNVAVDANGPMTIKFTNPISSFGAYLTYAVPVTMQAFDSSNHLIGTALSKFANNEAISGDPGSFPDELLSINSAPISKIVITGDPSGYSFALDDAAIGGAADLTPPVVTFTGTIIGPPKQVQVTSSDAGSGLASITVVSCTNCTASSASFTTGTNGLVVTTATKTDQSKSSAVKIRATDVAGNSTVFDPVDLTIVSDGRLSVHELTGIKRAEHIVQIVNGSPGIKALLLIVDDRLIPIMGLKDGETRYLDIGFALESGLNNKIGIVAKGLAGASVSVLVTQR